MLRAFGVIAAPDTNALWFTISWINTGYLTADAHVKQSFSFTYSPPFPCAIPRPLNQVNPFPFISRARQKPSPYCAETAVSATLPLSSDFVRRQRFFTGTMYLDFNEQSTVAFFRGNANNLYFLKIRIYYDERKKNDDLLL